MADAVAHRYPVLEVLKVHDADTPTFLLDMGMYVRIATPIRLLGWNSPELSTPEGKAAQSATAQILASATQIVVETVKDEQSFARWLGRVLVDGVDLGQLLANAGHAVPFGPHDKWTRAPDPTR